MVRTNKGNLRLFNNCNIVMLIMLTFCDVCSDYHISACKIRFPHKCFVNIDNTVLHMEQRRRLCNKDIVLTD